MSPAILYVDRSRVVPGAAVRLREGLKELARFVEDNEPRILSYHAYLDGDERLTVTHWHADAESLLTHLRVAGPQFQKFKGLVRLEGIDVYGEPGPEARRLLEEKAKLLGDGGVAIHPVHAGFARVETAGPRARP